MEDSGVLVFSEESTKHIKKGLAGMYFPEGKAMRKLQDYFTANMKDGKMLSVAYEGAKSSAVQTTLLLLAGAYILGAIVCSATADEAEDYAIEFHSMAKDYGIAVECRTSPHDLRMTSEDGTKLSLKVLKPSSVVN